MNSADQQSLIASMYQQDGEPYPSGADVSNFELLASDYCSDPFVNDDTIGGMRDSRPS